MEAKKLREREREKETETEREGDRDLLTIGKLKAEKQILETETYEIFGGFFELLEASRIDSPVALILGLNNHFGP